MSSDIDMEEIGAMTWAEVPFVVFDLETTGFSRDDRIVELGAVIMEGNRVVDQFHSLVNPGRPIPEEVVRIHGITDEKVKDAPRFRDVARGFFDFLFCGFPIVSHNLPFDTRMLAQQVDPSKWPANIYTLCTMDQARKAGHKGKAKLAELADHYNLEYEVEHAALSDSVVAGLLARRFARSYVVSQYYTKTTGEWAAGYLNR
jgi:DNA polymerase III subunit epsilon